METFATAALAFYAIGYFVLGGADIGTGMLVPVLARDSQERRLVVAAIVPFFLSHEVWLLATAGLLIGMFPVLEGELLGGLLPLFVPLLCGWVVRDAGLWFRGRVDGGGARARAWRVSCEAAVTAGSWLVAGCWSWILVGLLSGVSDRVVTDPEVAVAIAAVLVVFAVHGLAFAALRLDGEVGRRAQHWWGAGGRLRAFLLTSAVMATLVAVAGTNLPLAAAARETTLELVLPVVVVITPVLLAAQVWTWRLFGRRISDSHVERSGRG